VLLADHGEHFFEKGMRGSHGGDHYENVLRVPLAIWGPGVRPQRIDSRVSLADVTPTVLDLLGVTPGDRFSGSSLVPLLEGRGKDTAVVAEFTLGTDPKTPLRRAGWKHTRRETREELYSPPDAPGEMRTRIGEAPEILPSMRSEIDAHLAEGDRRFAA